MTENAAAPRSLKSSNFVWLCGMVSFDALVLGFAASPGFIERATLDTLAVIRTASSALLPVLTLVLTGLVDPQNKARLVFLRWNNPLPGSRAFSKYIHLDDRVSVDKLRKNVGAFPTAPKEQNAFWYSLYQKVKNDTRVVDSHKAFLLYRDMATLSIILLVISLCLMIYWHFDWRIIRFVSGALVIQYVGTLIGARNMGARLITTVLSIHSAGKITAARKPSH